jgi:hypothetical protein
MNHLLWTLKSWLARGVETLLRTRLGPSAEISHHSADRQREARQAGEKHGLREKTPRRVELIGLDVSEPPARLRSRSTAPTLAAVVVGALFLVALRTEVLHLRYAVASAVAEEQELSEQKRSLTVAMRKLRDPGHLTRLARELGFGRPERLIELSVVDVDPALGPAQRRSERFPEQPGVSAAATASVDSRP